MVEKVFNGILRGAGTGTGDEIEKGIMIKIESGIDIMVTGQESVIDLKTVIKKRNWNMGMHIIMIMIRTGI